VFRFAGVIGRDWRPMTLRELVVAHRAAMAARWDHTAELSWSIDNATCRLVNAKAGKVVAQPINRNALNPYRPTEEKPEPERPSLKINAENFSLLKLIFAPPR